MGEFLRGISAYGRALGLIGQHRLWVYLWAPAALSLLLGVVMLRTAWGLGDDIGAWLVQWYPWEVGRDWLARLANVLGGLLVVVLGLLAFRYVIMALSGPLMSLFSEQLEHRLYPHRAAAGFSLAKMFSDLVRGIRVALRNVWRELLFTVLVLLLGVMVPFIGPISAVLIFLIQAYYAGFGNMDFTLERYCGVRGSVSFVHQHRGLALGNGVVFMLMLLTVVGFVFAIPLGTAAATLTTLETLDAEGKLN